MIARTIWLTGLPCSGKTTLAVAVRAAMLRPSVVIDGDAIRKTLCSDLGYSESARMENVRRVSSVCRILNDQDVTAIVALVSPTQVLRDLARATIGPRFREVFLSCPLDVCISRDSKGMYKKALAGEISDFTGVSAPYQVPIAPELILDTSKVCVEDSVSKIVELIGLL